MSFKNILFNLPEVSGPKEKSLSFKDKLKWTLIILVAFFVLGMVPLFGLGANSLQQFEYLSIILGASFGSIISLGIGPIVTASIVLQLLNGSGLVKFDTKTVEGKKTFQGVQKLLALFFIVFEAFIYVMMGGLSPEGYTAAVTKGTAIFSVLQYTLIFQLVLGGIMIMLMDDVISKWGFGSGISLFIAAGVSQQIFIRAFSWVKEAGTEYSVGKFLQFFQALAAGDSATATLAFFALAFTVVVLAIAVYTQAMKVEIPLSFGRVRGYGMRWPLSFIYTSNIPVILVAALFANFQLWGSLLGNLQAKILVEEVAARSFFEKGMLVFAKYFGTVDPSGASSGIISWVQAPRLSEQIITNGFFLGWSPYAHALSYVFAMMIGCMIFSYFWVQTAGMDARSQAKQIMASGLQVPGFRKDERVLERLLQRYIGPLTIMGAVTIGLLASLADLTGTLSSGTGILLAVMIIYKLYEQIAKDHMMDMHPMMKKMMG